MTTTIEKLIQSDDPEDNELVNARRSFCAELFMEVMRDGGIRSWEDWAAIAEYHYQRNRQSYIDADHSGIISGKRTDKWLKKGYLKSADTRRFVRTYFAENGFYIANVVRMGVVMTDEAGNIRRDYDRTYRMVNGIADTASYRAIQLNKRKGMDLPLLVTQTLLPSGD